MRSGSALNGLLSVLVALLGLIYTGGATAATTQTDQNGTVLIDGQKVFPIVLAKGPERGSTTPDGADALDEVVDAGVNVFKVGPASDPWLDPDKQDGARGDRYRRHLHGYLRPLGCPRLPLPRAAPPPPPPVIRSAAARRSATSHAAHELGPGDTRPDRTGHADHGDAAPADEAQVGKVPLRLE